LGDTGYEGKAKTVAERQRDYRVRRQQGGGDRRLNTWISALAYSALEQLSERCGITKREMIELLVITVDTDVSAISKLNSTEWDAYFGTTSVTQ
jgi:hypothetical protein